MSKQKVAVVMGGPSREHEISLGTGQAMLDNLDADKYESTKVLITKDHKWIFDDTKELDIIEALEQLKKENALVLIGLHGTFGEDGAIQALLGKYNIPYTGSDAETSLLAMDKVISGKIYLSAGLSAPQFMVVETNSSPDVLEEAIKRFGFPLVIKPARQGSSVGVHIVKRQDEVEAAVQDALTYDQQVLLQQFVKGREVSCGVLEDPRTGSLRVLPPTELIPLVSEFFDYKAKYTQGGSKEVTPADMAPEVTAKIQSLALKAHELLGCSGYSRTDMIVTDSDIYVIETNTLPGMTKTSIIPQQAHESGISFSELLDGVIECALSRRV